MRPLPHPLSTGLGPSPRVPLLGSIEGPLSGPANDAPYNAILPAREIIADVNSKTAYRAQESARLDFSRPDRVPDDLLNDILWHAVKGPTSPPSPKSRN